MIPARLAGPCPMLPERQQPRGAVRSIGAQQGWPGLDFGKQVDLDSGIGPGDQVILNPAVDLADGSKVRARPQATQTS